MDILIDVVLPVVFIIVGVALIWLIFELIATVKRVRSKVTTTLDTLNPALENVRELTDELKPAVEGVDPLVQRLTLTVDAANLEIMRLDAILEDVTQVTDAAQKATAAVEGITNAPMDVMTSVTQKVRAHIKAPGASKESRELGAKKISQDEQNVLSGENGPVVQLTNAAIEAAAEVVAQQHQQRQQSQQEPLNQHDQASHDIAQEIANDYEAAQQAAIDQLASQEITQNNQAV
jgi:uncharacterized membrane-anchored protein YhcB (DUF1043 family)